MWQEYAHAFPSDHNRGLGRHRQRGGQAIAAPIYDCIKTLSLWRWWSSNRGLRDFLFCIFMPESQILKASLTLKVYQLKCHFGTVTFSRSRLLPFWTWWSLSLWKVRWMRRISLISLQRLQRFQKSQLQADQSKLKSAEKRWQSQTVTVLCKKRLDWTWKKDSWKLEE